MSGEMTAVEIMPTGANAIEQIVGQSAPVIAVYLDLLVVEIIVEERCGVGDDK